MNIEIFKEQVIPLRGKLHNIALRFLESEIEAEDTVQEVMLKLWAMREQLHIYTSIEALAVTIDKNICLNKIKARKTVSDKELITFADTNPKPDKQIELADSVAIVEKIIDALPELQKLIIRLRDFEDYTPDEIAQITGCNIEAVRMNLSRARKKVREVYFKWAAVKAYND